MCKCDRCKKDSRLGDMGTATLWSYYGDYDCTKPDVRAHLCVECKVDLINFLRKKEPEEVEPFETNMSNYDYWHHHGDL